jgi:hypothetical protein
VAVLPLPVATPIDVEAWRVVEAQHLISTRKLVDDADEQAVLEELVERSKPRPPPDAAKGLHFLLWTPFRYPPLRYGSRFGTPTERSLWYGSEDPRTALAETAYYRLVFLEGTSAELRPLRVELSVFSARMKTTKGADLVAAPFRAHRPTLASKTRYGPTQALGRAMRANGIEAFRWPSARDAEGGVNVGAFTPRVFGRRRPTPPQTWDAVVSRERVEVALRTFFEPRRHRFDRRQFLVRGRLPAPAV